MHINATLLGQMITFALFVLFTMKYVWPPITAALDERQKKIADGIAAAERSQKDLELAQHKIAEQLREARETAAQIVDRAKHEGIGLVDEARSQANVERERILKMAAQEVEQKRTELRESLRREVVALAISGAERVLGNSIDKAANQELLDKMVSEL